MIEIPVTPNQAVEFEAWAETTSFEQKTILTEVLPNADENPIDEHTTSGAINSRTKYGDTSYVAPATGSTVRIEVQHKNGTWVNSTKRLATIESGKMEVQAVDVKEEEPPPPPPPDPWDDTTVTIENT